MTKRIPRIRFPQRHSKPAGSSTAGEEIKLPQLELLLYSQFVRENCSAWKWLSMRYIALSLCIKHLCSRELNHLICSTSQPKAVASSGEAKNYRFKSDVPAAPTNTAIGGQASLLPKRTPLSDKEIEAILLGGCF